MIRLAIAAAWLAAGAVALLVLCGPARPAVPTPPGYVIVAPVTTTAVR